MMLSSVPGQALLFEREEFEARLRKVQAGLGALGADVAIFDEIEAMIWISGYGNSENRYRCCVVPRQGEPFFLIRALDATVMRQRSWIADVVTFLDWDDPMPVLIESLRQRGFGAAAIGVDYGSYGTSVRRFQALRDGLPEARTVDVGAMISELRLIKSPAELAMLRRASSVADQAMRRSIATVRAGATKRDIARQAIDSYIELGADPSLSGPIATGVGWDFLHGHLDSVPLTQGDICHIELTPRVNGYSARLMRCVALGAPTAKQQAISDRLIALQDAQFAAMRPGVMARDIDAIARGPMLAEGLRPSFENITGYTLGLYAPAGPRTSDFTRIFHPKADWLLEPGMVFHMYLSGEGLSISETVLVTEDGAERLTRLDRKLFQTD